MAVCKKKDGGIHYVAGAACPAGETVVSSSSTPAGGGSTTQPATGGSSSTRPTYSSGSYGGDPRMSWMPRRVTGGQSNIGSGDLYSPALADSRSGYWSEAYSAGDSEAAWDLLDPLDQSQFEFVAEQMGRGKTGAGLYADLVAASAVGVKQGQRLSPWDLLYRKAVSMGLDGPGGGGSSGGGGVAAPVADQPDEVKRVMNSLASDLLGRTLSDKEFDRYYGSYKKTFSGNPKMDMKQHGTEALQSNEDYQEFQVASKFASAMKSVLKGAS
jgi:hypothetical protein